MRILSKSNLCPGITLIELLLSLIVILALVFSAIKYYDTARNNAKVTQALAQINRFADASYQWMANQKGDFCGPPAESGANCSNPISVDKLLQGGYINQNDTQNPWGTKNQDSSYGITVMPNSSNPTNVQIIYDQIPQKSCSALVSKLKAKAVSTTCSEATNGSRFIAVF